MWKLSLFLLALGLFASQAFAQDNPGNAASPSAGYIRCPAGQSNVFLYESVTVFEVVSNLKCEDRVEVLGRVDTLGGYLRVRTADGKEGYVPQNQVTEAAPSKPRIAAPPPPAAVPAGQGSVLAGPLTQGPSSFGYDIPRVEAFGGYSYLNADWAGLATRSASHGWTGSATLNLTPLLGVEGGVSGNYQKDCIGAPGLNCTILTVMGGPRVTFHRGSSLTAFAHGLVGLGGLAMTLGGSSLTSRELAWAVGGGADYAVTERLSVRLGQFDYLRTQYLQSLGGGPHQNNFRVSAGVVLRIGKLITE
jgi:opacity protein-like surface antigen